MNQKKINKSVAEAQNDVMMNRLMIVFVIAVAAVTLVMSLRNANNEITMITTVAPIITWVLFALFAASVAFFVIRKKQKAEESERSFTKYNVLGMGCVSLLCAIAYAINVPLATGYAVAFILSACVLYFIYHIYAKDFFALSVFSMLEGLMLYTGYNNYAAGGIGYFIQVACQIGAIVLPVVYVVLSLIYKKKNGMLSAKTLVPTVICALIGLVGGVLLSLSSYFYVPSIYMLLALAAAYLAVGIVKTLRMI